MQPLYPAMLLLLLLLLLLLSLCPCLCLRRKSAASKQTQLGLQEKEKEKEKDRAETCAEWRLPWARETTRICGNLSLFLPLPQHQWARRPG